MAPQAAAEVELGAASPHGGEQVAAAERSYGGRKGATASVGIQHRNTPYRI